MNWNGPSRICPDILEGTMLVVWSPLMVWAPSSYGMVAILWFIQNLDGTDPPPPPCDLQRQFGPNTVYTYGRLAGCHRPPPPPEGLQRPFGPNTVCACGSKGKLGQIQCTHMAGWLDVTAPPPTESVRNALFNLVPYGNKRQRGGWTSHRSCLSTASGFVIVVNVVFYRTFLRLPFLLFSTGIGLLLEWSRKINVTALSDVPKRRHFGCALLRVERPCRVTLTWWWSCHGPAWLIALDWRTPPSCLLSCYSSVSKPWHLLDTCPVGYGTCQDIRWSLPAPPLLIPLEHGLLLRA